MITNSDDKILENTQTFELSSVSDTGDGCIYPNGASMAMTNSTNTKSNRSTSAASTGDTGFAFWRGTLHAPKFVVAPMVDQSELAWRMLSRKYGAELCYTPMLHASVFAKDTNYRRESLLSCADDRPLIVQFCANDPDTLLKAAKLAEDHCDAIDLNLGCPQVIAKRGHYGAFLQDEWELLEKMVKVCHENLKVPITCKIRIFTSMEKTVRYAKMLEAAGCQLLTVHGRTREQKGKLTGVADWAYIKAVRAALKIPVFANGNIQYLDDVHRCMEETGVQGVMIAEGNLHNPALFHGKSPTVWDMTFEYLDYVQRYPCPLSYMRGHVFKICHHALHIHRDIRDIVASAKSVDEFREVARLLKEQCAEDVEKHKSDPTLFTKKLPQPYWLCQPYVRPSPDEEDDPHHKELRERLNLKRSQDMQRVRGGDIGLSNNKLKKRLKHPHKNFDPDRKLKFDNCAKCPNPKGGKCEYALCKGCCRTKAHAEQLSCSGHNIRMKSRHTPETDSVKRDPSPECVPSKVPLQPIECRISSSNSSDSNVTVSGSMCEASH